MLKAVDRKEARKRKFQEVDIMIDTVSATVFRRTAEKAESSCI